MEISSLAQLKKEIQHLPPSEVLEICIRLIKYKKENKELLHYLLFESNDEKTYILHLKTEMSEMFKEVNCHSMHWAKKTIRKILRWTTKYGRYSGITATNIELLIHFCEQVKSLKINYKDSPSMVNLYMNQIIKIEKLVSTLHEDLQFDYKERIELIKR